MIPDGFSYQFAIRLPDGDFARCPQTGMMLLWDNEADAVIMFRHMEQHAAWLGVRMWGGAVVRRYCTPFVGDHDPAEVFLDELDAWLQQQRHHGTGGPQ